MTCSVSQKYYIFIVLYVLCKCRHSKEFNVTIKYGENVDFVTKAAIALK